MVNGIRGFSVAHLNIRSIKSKINELLVILDNTAFDVLTISETWLHALIDDSLIAINGYNIIRQDRENPDKADLTPKKGGGLLTYVSSDMVYSADRFATLNHSDENIEIQIFTVRKNLDKESVVINVYRPPSGQFNAFKCYVQQVLDVLSVERYLDIYFLGDVNLDHMPGNAGEHTQIFEGLLNSFGLDQKITSPTRRTPNKQSLLDVIYVKTNKKIASHVSSLSISDHYM